MKLKRIIESYEATGQYYDLGRDFASFTRMINSADEKISQQYEKQISQKLVGKRIRARASRGYKQYVKDYEFDVTKVTLEDYYDNFVIVAHDNATPKPKEYFLKPGFKIQILGSATGQPSPQKGGNPEASKAQKSPPQDQPSQGAQSQPTSSTPAHGTPSEQEPVKEDEDKGEQHNGYHDAYPMDSIAKDIEGWLSQILEKPGTAMRDFVKELGWQKDLGNGTSVAIFNLKIPANSVKQGIPAEKVHQLVASANKNNTKYEVTKLEPDDTKGIWDIRIKKTTTDKKV